MNTAKECAKIAGQIGRLAELVTPKDRDEYEQARKLAVFHLRSASKQIREIAEHRARKEAASA